MCRGKRKLMPLIAKTKVPDQLISNPLLDLYCKDGCDIHSIIFEEISLGYRDIAEMQQKKFYHSTGVGL
jgi:hypothetical protein